MKVLDNVHGGAYIRDMKKPRVIIRKITVEPDGPGFLVMDQDGCVTGYATKKDVEASFAKVDKIAAEHENAIVYRVIVWRT